MINLRLRRESWPLAAAFTISRGTKTAAEVVVVELEVDGIVGRGECVPYARYGETVDGVLATIEDLRQELARGLDNDELNRMLPAGAARNAIDCALWSLAAARAECGVHQLLQLPPLQPVTTAYTLSLGSPQAMATAAAQQRHRPLLKQKLAGDGADGERVAAVREAARDSRLIVDANEGCQVNRVEALLSQLATLGVEMVEQPLPADGDEVLAQIDHPLPVCADESCHTHTDLPRLVGRYDVINIKLDKTGGLSGALQLRAAARATGLRVMVGCMVATSLSMAPALLLAQGADWVDIDGPLLLARDRDPGLRYEGSTVSAAADGLWG